jgi:hypothetical protein
MFAPTWATEGMRSGDVTDNIGEMQPRRRGMKSVGPCELGFDPTVDASVEDVEREGASGKDLVVEGLEVELGARYLFC